MSDLLLSQTGDLSYRWNDEIYLPEQMGILISNHVNSFTISAITVKLTKQLYEYTPLSGTFMIAVYETDWALGMYGLQYRAPTGDPLVTSVIDMDAIPNEPLDLDNPGVSWTTPHTLSVEIPCTCNVTQYYALMFSVSNYTIQRGLGINMSSDLEITSWNIHPQTIHRDSIYGWNWPSICPYFALYGDIVIPRDPNRPDADTIPFPPSRPDDYDPDLIWTPDEWDGDTYVPPEWSDPEGIYVAAGGGRWCQNLVVAGNQKIYYEDYS